MSGSTTGLPMQTKIKQALWNESGQMAVFVALIFQVLFILFAMVINIGLIVHDKINLQNSVDLGAYYAAERQADALNEIAHINYQIRQDYKLMAWRYRVLGAFGAQNHPATSNLADATTPLTDTAYIPTSGPPAVCVGHSAWTEITVDSPTQNVCQGLNVQMPALQSIPLVAIFPGSLEAIGLFETIKRNVTLACGMISPFNWSVAASIVGSFKVSVTQRKKMILALSNEISASNDWNDISGSSIRAGVISTIKKNLTASNLASFSDGNVTMINGLSQGGCNLAGGAGFPSWLQEIQIEPHIPFVRLLSIASGDCVKSVEDSANATMVAAYAASDTTGELSQLIGEPALTSIQHSSRGFEKNPWCMAYVGVKATTTPRKPFAPFGSAMQMTARAFAQPFGGRIGPWDKAAWPQGNPTSNGTQALDPLAVPRGPLDSAAASTSASDSIYFPNYSRFPGDSLGLRSNIALGDFRKNFANAWAAATPPYAAKFKIADLAGIIMSSTTGDPLSWDMTDDQPNQLRSLEMAAVAPDLFDITYYSIDPAYYANYFSKRSPTSYGGIVPLSDLGSRPSFPGLAQIDVDKQVTSTQTNFDDVKKYAFYVIPSSDNVLTGWVQGRAIDYSTNSPTVLGKFGHCQEAIPNGSPTVPGNCIAGGRTGYSVRIVHSDYLKSQKHQLGGADGSTGALMNPPPDTF